ncbi:MAG: outer membrane protein assembly factor BamB family protein [Gammaproteobacteria bacterium]
MGGFSRCARLLLGKRVIAILLMSMTVSVWALDQAEPLPTLTAIALDVFSVRCVACHGGGALSPPMARFKNLTPEEIYVALRHGVMQEHATGLDDGQLRALGELLGDPEAEKKRPENGGALFCKNSRLAKKTKNQWRGWSADTANTRHLSMPFSVREIDSLRLKWSFVFPVTQLWSGGANPVSVADGRIYTASINKWVYALDAQTGCAYWAFQAEGRVRSNVAVEQGIAVFADLLTNVYALDAHSGRLLWRRRADMQATGRVSGSVAVGDGKVFVPLASIQEGFGVQPQLSCCTYNGSVAAYDLKSGRRLWRTFMIDSPLRYLGKNSRGANRYGPSGVSVFAPPTVDVKRGLVYIGTGNQHTGPFVPESDAVVALDITSGAKRWVASLAPKQFGGTDIYHMGCEVWADPKQENCPPENIAKKGDRDFAAPVMLISRHSRYDTLIAGNKDGMLYALEPSDGRIIWERRVGKGGELGGILFGISSDDRFIYAPVVDWDVGGQADGALNAVDVKDGSIIWRKPVPKAGCNGKPSLCISGLASPPLVLGDVVFSGGLDGILRAYDRNSGNVVWEYDAVRNYRGSNGLEGSGGAFGMGGAVAAGNMVYIMSGWDVFNIAMGGNVLLAFEWTQSKSIGKRTR